MLALRKHLRAFAYATPIHRWLGLGHQTYDKAFWDKQLAGGWKPYLGGTISVEARNTATLALLRIYAMSAKTVLDIGCASGSLYRSIGDGFTYTGVDISAVAVEEGRKQSPAGTFHASSIEDFQPSDRFDIIAFNEVLYFLAPANAVDEVMRYAKHLSGGGIIVVSMKNDAKSAAIFRAFRAD